MTRTSHTPELAAPTLAPAQKTGINLAAAAHLLVDVPPYPDMDCGDLIELFWNKCYVASRVLAAEDVGATVSLRVPESFIASGTARIHYRLMQVGQGAATVGGDARARSNSIAPAASLPPCAGTKTSNWHP